MHLFSVIFLPVLVLVQCVAARCKLCYSGCHLVEVMESLHWEARVD